MKKIIHESCLILLLFTDSKIIGGKKTGFSFRQRLSKMFSREKKTDSFSPQAFIPKIDIPIVFSLDEASIKLDNLEKQKKQGQEIDTKACNEVQNTLFSYATGSKIKIRKSANSNEIIGVCDTKGWQEDEDTRKEILTAYQRLSVLTNSSSELNESDDGIRTCDTRGFKKDNATEKKIENVQQRLAQLAILLNLELSENDNHIGTYGTNGWKRDEAKKKQVEAIRKKLILLSKTKRN